MHNGKNHHASENSRNQRHNTVLKEVMLKVLIIGDYGVGKTAIIRRYTEGKFSSNYKITIGADFSIKTIAWDTSTQVNMQLWDIAGHERTGLMTRVYYKYAVGAVIVFDISRISTFQSVHKWLLDIRDKVSLSDGSPIPIIVLANKCDISGVQVPWAALNKLCKHYGILKWFKTSAKTNMNIDEAMMCLITSAMKNKLKETLNDNIVLHKSKTDIENNSCCY